MYILAQVQYAGYDWLILGITKLLVIIAMLQLVKKLPELINTIFGTNIKTKGGIKGRLGEMAGIGGIAQKAWSSLGAGARNLAKAGLTLPAAGAALGADKLYQKKHDGKSLKDTKAFRQAKGITAGLRQAWKSGNILQAYEAYDKGTAAPSYTTGQRLSARNAVIDRMRAGTKDANGRSLIDPSGNFVNQYVDSDGNTHYVPISDVEKAQAGLMNDLRSRGDAGKFKAQEEEGKAFKSQLEMLDAKNKAAIAALNEYRSLHTTSESDGTMAGQIADSINKGNKLTDAQRNWMTKKAATSSDIKVANEQLTKMYTQSLDMAAKFDDYDGNTSQLAIGQLIGRQDGVIKEANSRYTQASQLLSDVDKDAIEAISTTYESSFKAHGGAYQNNGQLVSAMESFGNGGDVRFDTASGKYYDSTGAELKDRDKNVFELIKNGTVKTSICDYYGNDGLKEDYVNEFDKFVSEAKNDANASMAAMGIIPGDSNYETMYANEYYRSLHDNINKTYGTSGTKSTDPKAAEIRGRLNRIISSHILP